MAGPMRTDDLDAVKPPRPPNSWILYRKHVLKSLPPPGPGEPRRSQSSVSALVSQMWRNETEDTKVYFERLAEEAKTLHKIQFPNYRYQPKKKEDKDRLKEIQKLAKEQERLEKKTRRVGHRSGTATPSTSRASLAPSAPYFNPHLFYSSAGPSPPLSASSSPSDATPSPALASILPLPTTASSVASSSSLPSLVLPTPSYNAPTRALPHPFVPSPTPLVESFQVPNETSGWQFEDHPQNSEELGPTNEPAADNWDSTVLGGSQEQPMPSGSVLFDLPHDQVPWLEENAQIYGSFPQPSQGDAVYQLDSFDPAILSQDPQGEVEVSLGSQPQLHDNAFFESLFPANNDFLTSTIPFDSDQQLFNMANNDFTNMFLDFQEQSYQTTEASSSALTDFDPSPSHPPSEQPVASSSSYIPPSGAAYSSARRVGGNWANSLYAREQLMGQSPPVHAS